MVHTLLHILLIWGGCIDTAEIIVDVTCITPCSVDPTFDWSFGCPDIKVVPNEGDPTATHIWDFGDGTITSSTGGGIVYHTYTSNGTYTVTHIINLGGCIDTAEIIVDVTCITPCSVDPTFDWSFGCPDIKVVPNEGDPTATHIWDFGDGTITSSTGGGVVYHTYTLNGTYTVAHIINLGGCIDTAEIIVDVNCLNCCGGWPKSIIGVNRSIGGRAIDMASDNNGFVYAIGSSEFGNFCGTISNGGFLAKYDNCGELIWIKDLLYYPMQVEVDSDDEIVVMARFDYGASVSPLITKYNDSGAQLWQNSIYRPSQYSKFDIDQSTNEIYLGFYNDYEFEIIAQGGTGYAFVPSSYCPVPSSNNKEGLVVKFNPAGEIEWTEFIQNYSKGFALYDIAIDELTNDIVVSGAYGVGSPTSSCTPFLNTIEFSNGTNLTGFTNPQRFLTRLETTGNCLYIEPVSGPTNYGVRDLIEYDNDNEAIIRLIMSECEIYDWGAALINLFPTSINDNASDISPTLTNNFIATGRTSGNELVYSMLNISNIVWGGHCSESGNGNWCNFLQNHSGYLLWLRNFLK